MSLTTLGGTVTPSSRRQLGWVAWWVTDMSSLRDDMPPKIQIPIL